MSVDIPGLVDDFDHTSPDVAEHFYEVAREMRQRGPVVHCSRFGGFWAVTRYDDVRSIAKDAGAFRSGDGVTIPISAPPYPSSPWRSTLPNTAPTVDSCILGSHRRRWPRGNPTSAGLSPTHSNPIWPPADVTWSGT